jgi:hypothetical protein
MPRTFATLSKQAGADAKARTDHMGHGMGVTENTYIVTSLKEKLAGSPR